MIVAGVEAADPHAVGKIVKAHAVGAANEHSGVFDLARDPVAQQGFVIVFEKQAGEDRRGACAMGDRRIQAGFEPLVRGFLRVPYNDVEAVRAALDAGTLTVDARSEGEFVGLYTGDEDERPGTIPGAKNLPHDWISADGGGRMRSAGALKELFAARGIDPDAEPVMLIEGGLTAMVMVFLRQVRPELLER